MKDNHESQLITTDKEINEPAPSLREALKNNPQEVTDILNDILKTLHIPRLIDLKNEIHIQIPIIPPTSLIDNAINEVANSLVTILQETIQNNINPLTLCVMDELATFEKKYPEIAEINVIELSQAIALTQRLDASELKELYAELDSLPEPEESTETNPALKYKKYIFKAVQRGRERYEADKEEIIEKITTIPLGRFLFPVDKVNGIIWDNKDDISKTEIAIPLKAEPDKSKRQVTNTVILCLDELKDNSAIQRLTQYDLRVYMAIGNLYNAGNNKISIRDIYKAMGNNSNLASSQKKKILLSIEKMSSIRITIDTTEEEQAGYRYPNLHIKRRNLLYTKVDVALKRGQETEVIELMEEPVLFQFALARNQYTTIPATLLCSPVSKTEATLAIENYLLKRITERGKNGGTILLSTVYEKAGIQTRQQKHKAKEKIKTLLDYWKEQGFISDYDICMNDNKAKPEECIKIKEN